MVNPSRPRKEGVRCRGTLKKGSRAGQACNGLILGRDDLSVVCRNCGDPHRLLDLLNEVMEQGYLYPESVFTAVPSLHLKKEVRNVQVKKGQGAFCKKVCQLLKEVFDIDISGSDAENRFTDSTTVYFFDNQFSHMLYSDKADFAIVSDTWDFAGRHLAVVSDDGVVDFLCIRVRNPEYLSRAKRFARRLETLTKKIQETPSQVTVIKDF